MNLKKRQDEHYFKEEEAGMDRYNPDDISYGYNIFLTSPLMKAAIKLAQSYPINGKDIDLAVEFAEYFKKEGL